MAWSPKAKSRNRNRSNIEVAYLNRCIKNPNFHCQWYILPFIFLELKEVQDCTEYRFEIFSFARVSPHAVVGPSPSEKKKKNHGRSIIH